MSDEQAKAVQEVAKTTGEIVKAAGGVGSYLARVFGSIPTICLGYWWETGLSISVGAT
jgi:hypothetical protein